MIFVWFHIQYVNNNIEFLILKLMYKCKVLYILVKKCCILAKTTVFQFHWLALTGLYGEKKEYLLYLLLSW